MDGPRAPWGGPQPLGAASPPPGVGSEPAAPPGASGSPSSSPDAPDPGQRPDGDAAETKDASSWTRKGHMTSQFL